MHPQHFYRRQDLGSAERLLPAMVLIGIGVLFLLSNLHIAIFADLRRWWPALLVAFGVVKLVDSDNQGGRVFGGMVFSAGGLLLARNFGYMDFSMRNLWPLFLIGAGVMMLLDRTIPLAFKVACANKTNANRLREDAFFSGGKRNITTPDFQGGKVTAIFGGYELDFTRAGMLADSATMHVDVVFGGCEIRIPPNWSAVTQGTGIFGAFSDESLQPDRAVYPNVKQLIIKGGAVFGGVVVKN